MGNCRNCGSVNLVELGFVGEIAPFFLKRVLDLKIGPSIARHPLRILAQKLCTLPQHFFQRIYGSSVFMEMQLCLSCSFIQTKHAFADDALARLYADYRETSYNEERISFEPSYAGIVDKVGRGNQEVETRVGGLTSWLSDKIQPDEGFSILDFGGYDGRFLPRIPGEKFVFDVAAAAPLPGVTRVVNEADLATYNYVQIGHVLEHVANPLVLLKHVSSFVKPNGYLYIEVPQDRSDEEIGRLKNGEVGAALPIHEHINVYCSDSVTALVKAAGLVPVKVEAVAIDLGWIKGTNIRALAGKLVESVSPVLI